MKLSQMVQSGNLTIGRRTYNVRIRDEKTFMLKDAHNRANEAHQQNRNRRSSNQRRQGSVSLSNTDSVSRANRIRARLRGKLSEIMGSSLDHDTKMALARTVQIQLDRVEMKVRQIRRRERAKEEEKRENRARERREEDARTERRREQERARRRRDMSQRSVRIRRDFLYPASKGGFDPYSVSPVVQSPGANAAVSFDIGGSSGTVSGAAPVADIVDVLL